MGGIVSQSFPIVREILHNVIGDTGVNEAVTYRRYKKQEYSEDLGYVASSYDDFSMTVLRLKHNAKSAALVTGNVQVGDVQVGDDVFIIENGSCPVNMSLKDVIVDSTSAILKVSDVKSVFDLAKIVTIEGGGIQK